MTCPDPVALLAARLARAGAAPLITWYDTDRDERVELSARTFANWVDKTVNLLDDLGCADAPAVGVPVMLERPGHWVGLVWVLAAWQLGGHAVALDADALGAAGVDVAVFGPQVAGPLPGSITVACSLHPFGLGLTEPIPGVLDYREVIAQPDAHWTAGRPPVTAFIDAQGDHSLSEDAGLVEGRVLVRPSSPWTTLAQALLAPLAGGGSAVVVAGSDPDLAALATAERAKLVP